MTKLRVLRFVLAIIMFNYSFPPVLFAADILSTQKKLYSQHDEELIIRDFFNDEKGGFFVDIGAGDYKELSNTYYLEKNLGWKGVAVDAQERYEADYKKFRPSTRYFNYIVTDGGGSDQDFFNVEQFPATSTTNPNWLRVVPLMVNMKPDEKLRVRITKVPVVTLNKLLELNGITKIDLLSLDIELGEPAALAGFDIDKYRPRLVCVEAQPPVQQKILIYFLTHRYELVRKYLKRDGMNWYFKPIEAKSHLAPAASARH